MHAKDAGATGPSLPQAQPTPSALSWVEKTPGVCGGDACIRKTRIPVWGLIEWRRLGLSDAEIREQHPDLTPADLEAAWEYYAQHPEEIDQAIRENEAA
jgi:uncharacterized protein (DUF433 family)